MSDPASVKAANGVVDQGSGVSGDVSSGVAPAVSASVDPVAIPAVTPSATSAAVSVTSSIPTPAAAAATTTTTPAATTTPANPFGTMPFPSLDPTQLAMYQQMFLAYQQMLLVNMQSLQTPPAAPEGDSGENSGFYNMFGTMDPAMYNYYTQMMYQMMQNPLLMQQQTAMYMQNPLLSMLTPLMPAGGAISSVPQRKPEEYTEDPPEDCKLFVGGMPAEVNDAIFKNYFQQFGPVRSATVVRNRETGLSRGFGFVEFRSRIVGLGVSVESRVWKTCCGFRNTSSSESGWTCTSVFLRSRRQKTIRTTRCLWEDSMIA